MGSAAPPPPAAEPAPASNEAAKPAEDGVLSQDELNALFAAGAAPSAPTPAPAPPADSDGALSQAELDALMGGDAPPPAPAPPPKPAPAAPEAPPAQPFHSPRAAAPPPIAQPVAPVAPAVPDFEDSEEEDEEGVARGDIDYLLKRADDTLRSIAATPVSLPAEIIEFQYPEFGGTVPSSEHATLDQISEVELDVKIELGRTDMYLEDILKLRKGSVVPLDKLAGESVDIYINDRLLARGEVLVMNENFCVRVAELLAGAIPME
jgi:flagellar motor switch protein FliN/FliY